MGTDSIRSSWQAQPVALAALTSKLLRRKAWLQAWRLRVSAVVSVVMLGGFGLALVATAYVSETWLCRVGCALAGFGYIYTTHRVFRLALVSASPADVALQSCLDFYRAGLQRQRDAMASCLSWGILPSAPGVVLALLGWIISSPGQWVSVAGVAALWAAVNLANWRVCTRQAAELHDEIELLDAVA
jgi:hypothetical protein